jgi:putative endonuclease
MCSVSGTLYIGLTNSISRRAFEHKNKLIEGFTTKYECNRLVYYEEFDDVQNAINREKELKGWARKKKIELIETVNSRWQDLSLTWGWQMLMPKQAIKDARESSQQFKSRLWSGDPSLRSG